MAGTFEHKVNAIGPGFVFVVGEFAVGIALGEFGGGCVTVFLKREGFAGETGEGIDEAKVKLGLFLKRGCEAPGIERKQQLVELGRGDGAPSVLDSCTGFLLDQG